MGKNKLNLFIGIIFVTFCFICPLRAVLQLEATYDLYKETNRSKIVTSMTIFNQKGTFFLIQGTKWGGSGNINGSNGYYDWNFLDGRSGRTTFSVLGNGNLRGHVSGSGIDWVYIAIPRTRPKPEPEPKSCKACFDEEKVANKGCTGTSTQKLKCYKNNEKVRLKCQGSCKLP